jgi:hypothetical protein
MNSRLFTRSPLISASAGSCVLRSARLTAASLTKRSPIIKALVDAKQLKIAVAMHDVTTGKVSWFS